MELFPTLEIGWLNGWVLLAFEFLIQGTLLMVFPKDVVSRLFDRSGWSVKQKVYLTAGKVFSLLTLVLIILTPMKIHSEVFILGLILYGIGVAGLVLAMYNFKDTALDQPVTIGLYKISRHPQIVAQVIFLLGICIAIGSWVALFSLLLSKLLQHLSILAEEEVCVNRYGDSYRTYMKKVPRYFLFF
jgi:protein-S-isoprenylcysteine O-methyltransferase Ste14